MHLVLVTLFEIFAGLEVAFVRGSVWVAGGFASLPTFRMQNPAQFIRGAILVICLCRYYIESADLGNSSVRSMLLSTAEASSPLVLHDVFIRRTAHGYEPNDPKIPGSHLGRAGSGNPLWPC